MLQINKQSIESNNMDKNNVKTNDRGILQLSQVTACVTHLLALDSCLQPKLLTTSKTTMEILFQVSLD